MTITKRIPPQTAKPRGRASLLWSRRMHGISPLVHQFMTQSRRPAAYRNSRGGNRWHSARQYREIRRWRAMAGGARGWECSGARSTGGSVRGMLVHSTGTAWPMRRDPFGGSMAATVLLTCSPVLENWRASR